MRWSVVGCGRVHAGRRAPVCVVWRSRVQGGQAGAVDRQALACRRQEATRRLPVHRGRGSSSSSSSVAYSAPAAMQITHTTHTHTQTHARKHARTFNGPLSGTTRVSRYQKGETNLDFSEARDSEWQRVYRVYRWCTRVVSTRVVLLYIQRV